MSKKRAPLFADEDRWVNVTAECILCGSSLVSIMARDLATREDVPCPMCGEAAGIISTVEAL